jgi:hypothetical protein
MVASSDIDQCRQILRVIHPDTGKYSKRVVEEALKQLPAGALGFNVGNVQEVVNLMEAVLASFGSDTVARVLDEFKVPYPLEQYVVALEGKRGLVFSSEVAVGFAIQGLFRMVARVPETVPATIGNDYTIRMLEDGTITVYLHGYQAISQDKITMNVSRDDEIVRRGKFISISSKIQPQVLTGATQLAQSGIEP